MAIVIIESIGFCATHSISDMLRMDGENYVSHGTKNFEENTPIGQNDLTFPKFFAQMQALHANYTNCIAVHSLFHPAEVAQVSAGSDAKFYGLARKSQRKQVLSCFYWALNGLLSGRQDMLDVLANIHKNCAQLLNKIGLQSNLISCWLLYAIQHVSQYNVALALNAQAIFFMEDVIEDPNHFAKELGVIDSDRSSLQVKQGPSHKDKVKAFDFLQEVDDVLPILLDKIATTIDKQQYKLQDVENLLLHKAQS